MGNMLESDSSTASDIETNEGENIRARTAGDGMECDTISKNDSGLTPIRPTVLHTSDEYPSADGSRMPPAVFNENPKNRQHVITGETSTAVESVVSHSKDSISRSSSVNSFTSKEHCQQILRGGLASKSPTQLPSKDLLIPIKPVKFENNTSKGNNSIKSSSSYEKFTAAGPAGVGKQKSAKFVPYEPYSCATRPIVNNNLKHHTRKPSDSSSVVSQSSTLSTSEQSCASVAEANKSTAVAITTAQAELLAAKNLNVQKNTKMNTPSEQIPGNTSNPHNSTALMKERLKMAEKDVNELQTENARLKKLLVDSISGASLQTTSLMNQNIANGNAHRIHESFDNLNDEINVWRSKFLSSCVLVEQLTKDNQTLSESVNSAAVILKGLKHSLPLTPGQYEVISEWFRQAKPLIQPGSMSLHGDENFNCDDNGDASQV